MSPIRFWLLYVFWYPSYWWATARLGMHLGMASLRDRPLDERRQSCLRAAGVLDSDGFRTTMAALLRLERRRFGKKSAQETRKLLSALRDSVWAVAKTL